LIADASDKKQNQLGPKICDPVIETGRANLRFADFEKSSATGGLDMAIWQKAYISSITGLFAPARIKRSEWRKSRLT